MKTARLKEELVVPGYWHSYVNHDGENEVCWIPPCKYPANTEFEVIKEGIACGLEKEVLAPHVGTLGDFEIFKDPAINRDEWLMGFKGEGLLYIPDGTHIAVCRWERYPATEDQIGMAEMFVVPVTMLEVYA